MIINIIKYQMLKILQVIMISSLVLSLGSAAPLMIEEK